MRNLGEKIFHFIIAFAIGIIPVIFLLSWINMNALANDLEKAYHDNANAPQVVALDSKYDYRCTDTVEILAGRGYTVSINGFVLKPESIEAKGICQVNPKALRYWKQKGVLNQHST